MVSINLSDLEMNISEVKTSTKFSKYTLLDNALGRYLYYQYVKYSLNKNLATLDKFSENIRSLNTSIEEKVFIELTEMFDEIIELIHESVKEFKTDEMFTESQLNKLNIIFKSYFKKATKAKSLLSRNYYKGKSKNNDAHLISLIINNNQLELQKNFTK